MKSTLIAAAALSLLAGPLAAEPLTAEAVKAMLAAGPLRYTSGSVGTFLSDGTYTFTHKGFRKQAGSYSIDGAGVTTFIDRGEAYSFVIDRSKNGKRHEVVFTAGPFKGHEYPLR